MAKQHSKRQFVIFQKTENNLTWHEYFSCHAYINGLSGTEYFMANAGYDSALTVEIECRYCPELMKIIPSMYRAVDGNGIIYELISPADDIRQLHNTVKFRGKRITNDNI